MSPVQRSLKLMRERGWTCYVVEKYNSFARVRQDAFGFGDILACLPWNGERDGSIALIQTTTRTNMAARRKKILNFKMAQDWKRSGGQIILHGWKGSELQEERL